MRCRDTEDPKAYRIAVCWGSSWHGPTMRPVGAVVRWILGWIVRGKYINYAYV
jgi:hypothetical protein